MSPIAFEMALRMTDRSVIGRELRGSRAFPVLRRGTTMPTPRIRGTYARSPTWFHSVAMAKADCSGASWSLSAVIQSGPGAFLGAISAIAAWNLSLKWGGPGKTLDWDSFHSQVAAAAGTE